MRVTLLFLILILQCSITSFAQFGDIDSSFGEDGKVTTNSYNLLGHCVSVQKSGRIIVGGTLIEYTGSGDDFYLAGFYANGLIDKNFGNNGSTVTNVGGDLDDAYDMTIQQDGKILLAGRYSFYTGVPTVYSYFGLVRYTPDGLPDSTFGDKGIVTSRFEGIAGKVLELSDKKILVGGIVLTRLYDDEGFPFIYYRSQCIIKYNSNGTPDTSFGNYGVAKIDFGDSSSLNDHSFYPDAEMKVQQDGKILIGGTLQSADRPVTSSDLVLVRLNPNGTIDSTFGENGITITDIDKSLDGLSSMLLLGNDKIIVTANFSHGKYLVLDSIAVLRYNVNGTVDSSFGKKGKVILSYGNKPGSNSTSSLLLPNGEIVISGYSYYDSSFLLIAINKNGILDSSFGNNGFTVTSFKSGNGTGNNYAEFPIAYDMDITPDGKIVVAGTNNYKAIGENYNDIALARYYGETVLPITLFFFTATKKQSSISLNWQTASENNNAYFAVEHSNNSNSSFKEIGRVNSKGNSSQLQQYSFEDFAPLTGGNYYRLKQVDKDGNATYSKIVFIDFVKEATIRLYPNPVKNVITIEGLTGNKTTVSIIDVNGRVLTTTSTNDAIYTWNIKALPQGTYYLRTEADKKVNTIKFVKE